MTELNLLCVPGPADVKDEVLESEVKSELPGLPSVLSVRLSLSSLDKERLHSSKQLNKTHLIT